MGFFRQPQNVWIRRAMFQIHLWTGIGVGLYIVVVCLTFERVFEYSPEDR